MNTTVLSPKLVAQESEVDNLPQDSGSRDTFELSVNKGIIRNFKRADFKSETEEDDQFLENFMKTVETKTRLDNKLKSRVKSFSPVQKHPKGSFGLTYDQRYRDSAESAGRSKPKAYMAKTSRIEGSRDTLKKSHVPVYDIHSITVSKNYSSKSKGKI